MKKIEKAIEKLMASIGCPYYCVICEDWFPADHFEFNHVEKNQKQHLT